MLVPEIFFILAGVQSIVLVVYMLRIAALPHEKSPDDFEPSREQMREFILWKSFYVNPRDPRVWVPKTSGWGWTVNFRKKSHAVVFGIMILDTFLFAALGFILMLARFANAGA